MHSRIVRRVCEPICCSVVVKDNALFPLTDTVPRLTEPAAKAGLTARQATTEMVRIFTAYPKSVLWGIEHFVQENLRKARVQ